MFRRKLTKVKISGNFSILVFSVNSSIKLLELLKPLSPYLSTVHRCCSFPKPSNVALPRPPFPSTKSNLDLSAAIDQSYHRFAFHSVIPLTILIWLCVVDNLPSSSLLEEANGVTSHGRVRNELPGGLLEKSLSV